MIASANECLARGMGRMALLPSKTDARCTAAAEFHDIHAAG
jgi:hypothetical protein